MCAQKKWVSSLTERFLLKNNSESNFYLLYRSDNGPDSAGVGHFHLIRACECMRLQMTTVWVKNNLWETKTVTQLRNRKQKYLQNCSICTLPQWAFPCFSKHHPSARNSQRAAGPQGAGPYKGPKVKFGKYILHSLPENHSAHQHIKRSWAPSKKEPCLVVLRPLVENVKN